MPTGDDAVVEAPGALAGDPDGLQRLWTPHRAVYLGGENKPTGDGADTCPFCRAAASDDDADVLVVARGRAVFALLNLYPYNSGHLMVLPYRHVADYTELTADEGVELGTMTADAMRTLRAVYRAQGFNLGVNQGSAAGAGIAAHLHQHVVPRWTGDANFLPVVGRTKTLPELLADTRKRLADAWPTEGRA
ncbi:HIT family protein [Actinotalea fermentans]|uniref:Hydrolase n=1 Tax=Actinotalea fermentans TaxID=43671 RepID=A0A511YUE1_9CELL|nr:HIT domain-containing protein [Actinotalea fermentans]KGM17295.1 HIT family hydrolase [Actinotalea fermentans ATCC 43279 = JCM 9966 = DSM 3133]GEN78810.1 hydrolase [Actinotalea fermentans]